MNYQNRNKLSFKWQKEMKNKKKKRMKEKRKIIEQNVKGKR